MARWESSFRERVVGAELKPSPAKLRIVLGTTKNGVVASPPLNCY